MFGPDTPLDPWAGRSTSDRGRAFHAVTIQFRAGGIVRTEHPAVTQCCGRSCTLVATRCQSWHSSINSANQKPLCRCRLSCFICIDCQFWDSRQDWLWIRWVTTRFLKLAASCRDCKTLLLAFSLCLATAMISLWINDSPALPWEILDYSTWPPTVILASLDHYIFKIT